MTVKFKNNTRLNKISLSLRCNIVSAKSVIQVYQVRNNNDYSMDTPTVTWSVTREALWNPITKLCHHRPLSLSG